MEESLNELKSFNAGILEIVNIVVDVVGVFVEFGVRVNWGVFSDLLELLEGASEAETSTGDSNGSD